MRYLNPEGHNYGSENVDVYGISQVSVAVLYSLFFYAACFYVWLKRYHPILRMRKVGLALLSLLVLHVYLFMIFMVYTINGAFPCGVEFWTMSIYLPIGIGLFQAQNQQLLIVSKEQTRLVRSSEFYKPYLPYGPTMSVTKYWGQRFRDWWNNSSRQGRYEAFVFVGMWIQLTVSIVLYCLSRKFNSYGLISHAASPAMCRRGWEWLPSIVWQFLWNFFFGPCLIWKIRMIRDIYHWRLQTILAIVAGIPGTPIWIAAIYSDGFSSINKYWVPAMWFVPGLVTMELTTLLFPIIQIWRHDRAVRETNQALADFDTKRLKSKSTFGDGSASMVTRSTGTKNSGRMFSMESLDECLHANHDGLQIYASCVELNGENIIFLVRVLAFRDQWIKLFSRTPDFARKRMLMFRAALNVFTGLVYQETAVYPINIESPVYQHLSSIFRNAAELVASQRRVSVQSSPTSQVTPWDDSSEIRTPRHTSITEHFPMQNIASTGPMHRLSSDSKERMVSISEAVKPLDPLAGYPVPVEFDDTVFEPAFKSIKYMVWTETWQRYMQWKKAREVSA